MDDTILKLGVPALFILLGIWLVASGVKNRRIGQASVRWPVTKGRVLASYLDDKLDGDWMPVVRYEYTVAGKRYENDGIELEMSLMHRFAAEDIAAQYPQGAEVDVRYDSAAPDRSLLAVSKYAGLFQLGMGVLFIALSLAAFYEFWWRAA